MIDLKYDYKNMLIGISEEELNSLEPELIIANKRFVSDLEHDDLAFYRLLDASKELMAVKYTADRLKKSFENLIVIGIGGSDLGARAIFSSLCSAYHNQLNENERGGMRVYFCGDTTDPKPLEELLEAVDLKKSAIHVVSKSGSTIETMTTFFIIQQKLIKKVGKEQHKNHVIVTTDPEKGHLHDLATKEGYKILAHDAVGGRFSVLSSTGLLAAACAGLNIDEIVRGAQQVRTLTKKSKLTQNSAFIYAALHFLGLNKGKNICILMPYVYKLNTFGAWFRQLWAESLGKNGLGQTPVPALGPTDQHSQLQLYQDGPNDKQITFISSESDSLIKTPAVKVKGIEYFGEKKLSDLLKYEHEATSRALTETGKPNGTIVIEDLNENTLGQLFFFFELVTFYSGALYKINAFDQPGVELSKKYIHQLAGKKY